MKIKNRQIDTPIFLILKKLQSDLRSIGNGKLKVLKEKGTNAIITCPNNAHKQGLENNPSCSVLLEDKPLAGLSKGYTSCFACKYRASLTEMISMCFNVDDNGEYGEQWLLANSDYSIIGGITDRVVPQIPDRFNPTIQEETKYVSEEELASYRFYHPYMWQRKLTPEIVDKFDIGYDSITDSITFPIYDNKGNCLSVVKRRTKIKYFEMPDEVKKFIFGLNHITEDITKVIVCESVLDALVCWTHGKPAIALFGTGSHEQVDELNKSHIRHFVLAFDGDDGGKRGEAFVESKLYNKIITKYKLPPEKDLNDLSWEEFENLVEYL